MITSEVNVDGKFQRPATNHDAVQSVQACTGVRVIAEDGASQQHRGGDYEEMNLGTTRE